MFDLIEATPITAGFSSDRKLRAVDRGGRTVLLRICKPGVRETLEACEALLTRAQIAHSELLAVRESETETQALYRWIDGKDLRAYLPQASQAEQYRIGREAGAALRRLHGQHCPETFDWQAHFAAKAARKLAQYESCGLRFAGDEAMIDHIRRTLPLTAGRPLAPLHGDYHVGNLMEEGGSPVVIDYTRLEYGDPLSEFDRLIWDVACSPAFARGRVDGYLAGQPDKPFFALTSLYVCVNMISSIPWAVSRGDEQIELMIALAEQVTQWYDGFTRVTPRWYRA